MSTMSYLVELENNDSVYVTHVESPVLFYCRLEKDDEQFNLLNDLISKQVNLGLDILPNISNGTYLKRFILVFSAIRNCWCRGKLLFFQMKKYPFYAKVLLIDYGSIEFVPWKNGFVLESNDEINSFNNEKGFCFPCSLGNIKPNSAPPIKSFNPDEWGSYANFILEKETKHRKFMLQIFNCHNNIIACDLLPIDEFENEEENVLLEHSFMPMSEYLVKSNVARYLNESYTDNRIVEDEEKENRFIATTM